MKRAMTIMAVAAGALAVSMPARAADEPSTAERIINAVYADLGLSANTSEP